MSTTVRIPEETHAVLRGLAESSGKSMAAVLDEAVELYRRARILESINAAYGRLRADEPAWVAEQAERELWGATIADGLEDE